MPIEKRIEEKVYANRGNAPLLALLPKSCSRILDVGCGAGDNARLIRNRFPAAQIVGITASMAERETASHYMTHCLVADIEQGVPELLHCDEFDVVIFSHVLEHLAAPWDILPQFCRLLRSGGILLIAVPNAVSWRQRLHFLLGRFEYTDEGVLDQTHLRFFSFNTCDRYLFSRSPDMKLLNKVGYGSFPLWIARRSLLPKAASIWIDRVATRLLPNLFAGQVLIVARKEPK